MSILSGTNREWANVHSLYFLIPKFLIMELEIIFTEHDTLQTFFRRYSHISMVNCPCIIKIDRIAMAMLSCEEIFMLAEFLQDRNMVQRPTIELISLDIRTHQHSPSHN
jgi:hypothetical protein